jgi:hypothetical protein
MHAAPCWALHPEGEIVSAVPQDRAYLHRRCVLQLCAASLSAAALRRTCVVRPLWSAPRRGALSAVLHAHGWQLSRRLLKRCNGL